MTEEQKTAIESFANSLIKGRRREEYVQKIGNAVLDLVELIEEYLKDGD